MAKVITFGEIMLRLNPEGYLRFTQSPKFEASYAGGEANVAVSLANYGLDAAFVTKVPKHDIGQCAINALRQFGVDTTMILRGGDRLGAYFVEKGASQRPARSSMTVPILPLPPQQPASLTGSKFSAVLTGSTGPASPPL